MPFYVMPKGIFAWWSKSYKTQQSMRNTEETICEVLARHVQVLSLPQIANAWFSDSPEPLGAAGRYVRRLAKRGILHVATEMLHPELDVSRPLLEWEPEMDQEPDLGRLAWRAKIRFSKTPARTVVVRLAGKELRRSTALIHDVMLAAVFLNYFKRDSSVLERWRAEQDISASELDRFGQRLPDAIIQEENQEVLIECIGAYDKRRLTRTFLAWKEFAFRFY